MKEYKCTNCGNTESTRWKLIKDEVLCSKCHSPSGRQRITSRSDIEISVLSSEESMAEMAND